MRSPCIAVLLTLLGWAQTVFYSQDFTTGVPADWSLNTNDVGSSTTNLYNHWVVGADYNPPGTVVEVDLSCGSGLFCFPTPIPSIPAQPAAIPGAPNGAFLHVSYLHNSNYSGCNPPSIVTTSFLAADGSCPMTQHYFARMNTPVAIPAGSAPVKLSFFWLCRGGPSSYGEVYYSTNGTTWQILTSSVTNTTQLNNRYTSWQADTINLPITRPSNVWIGFRFYNAVATTANDPPLAVDALRIFEAVPPTAPTIDLTCLSPNPVCSGSSLTVNFTPSGTFGGGNQFTVQLSDASGSFAAPIATATGAASPITLTVPPATPSGTYRVRVVSSSPAVVSDTLDVTIVNVQSLSCTANPNPVNVNTPVTLTLNGTGLPSGPFNVTVNSGDGSPVQTQNGVGALPVSFSHTYTTAGTYTVTFTITHTASGCQGTCQVPVVVSPPSTNTIDLTSVSPNPICAGNTLTVNFASSGTFGGGNQFTAQLSNAAGSFAAPLVTASAATSPITLAIPATVASGTYKVRIVSSNPAVVSDTLDVAIVNLQNLSCSATPNPVLAGSPAALTLDGSGLPNGPFDVTVNLGDGSPAQTQNGVALPYTLNHAYAAPGTYTVTFTLAHPASGCQSTCQVTVTVNATGLSAQNLQPGALCAGEVFTVDYTSQGVTFNAGNTFTVEGRDRAGNVVFSCPTAGTAPSGTLSCQVPAGTPPGTYSVTVSSSDPVYQSGSLSLTVQARPVASFTIAPADRVCLGTPITLTSTSQSAQQLSWDLGNGQSATGGTASVTYPAPGSYTVTLVASVSSTCTDTIRQTIEVMPLPTAAFTASSQVLTLPNDNTVSFTNASTGATTYQWNFGNGETSTAVNPTVAYMQVGTYTVILMATSADGCQDTAQQVVVVRTEEGLSIPNAFTPNGDGMNDAFVIRYAGAEQVEAMLYDRWGNLIWQQAQTALSGQLVWDGTRGGSPAPEGVYTGVIRMQRIDGQEIVRGFTLTLLR